MSSARIVWVHPQPHWYAPSNASYARDLTEVFEITHPFHPHVGRRFELVSYRHNWGEHRVMYRDERGRICSLPAGWTSVPPADPYVAVAGGRSLFRPEDLVALEARVRSLLSSQRTPGDAQVGRRNVK